MKTTPIISRNDRVRVLETFAAAHDRISHIAHKVAYGASPAHIERLLFRLQHAQLVKPTMIPKDLVTMNSIVRLCDQRTLKQQRVALIYPDDRPCDLPVGVEPIEIQTELGSEMLGRRLGEAFTVSTGGIPTELRVSAIEYQPEAAGDLDR